MWAADAGGNARGQRRRVWMDPEWSEAGVTAVRTRTKPSGLSAAVGGSALEVP